MTSPLREFEKGSIYHILNRGNHKERIFRDDQDRRYFLSKLDVIFERLDLTLMAYCLMDNHYHLLIRQDGKFPINKAMQSLVTSYVKRYNSKYRLVGGLFQGRYVAKQVSSEKYLAYVSCYIHLNPEPYTDYRQYPWSSYRQYVGKGNGMSDPTAVLDLFDGSKINYAIYVQEGLTSEVAKQTAKVGVAAG
jgi:putative transposase